MDNAYELGMILDDHSMGILSKDCFEKIDSPDNMTNYANESMLISFYSLPNGNSFLWSINLMKGEYNSLGIKIGSNLQEAENNILAHSFKKQVETTLENGKKIIVFDQGQKQVTLHFENDKLFLAQIIISNPGLYKPQYNDFSQEKRDISAIEITDRDYKYQLGMVLDDELQKELMMDNYVENNLKEQNEKLYSKENAITLSFLPLLDGTFVLSSITILNNEYSLYNVTIGDMLTREYLLNDIFRPKGFQLIHRNSESKDREEYVLSDEINWGISLEHDYKRITGIKLVLLSNMMPHIYHCYEAQVLSNTSSQKYCLYMSLDTNLKEQLEKDGFLLTSHIYESFDYDGNPRQYTITKYHNMDLILDVGIDNIYHHKIIGGILIRSEQFSIYGIHIGDNINDIKEILSKHDYIEEPKDAYAYRNDVLEYRYRKYKTFYISFKVFEDIIQTIYIARY